MVSGRTASPSLPNTRKLTIVAQDPSVRIGGRILTTEVEIPAEELLSGPCGYRINVIDYDSTNNVLYDAAELGHRGGQYLDPFSKQSLRLGDAATFNRSLLENPKFHAQNAYPEAARRSIEPNELRYRHRVQKVRQDQRRLALVNLHRCANRTCS